MDPTIYEWDQPDDEAADACWVCGSTETVEIHDPRPGHDQSILVCANCGNDE